MTTLRTFGGALMAALLGLLGLYRLLLAPPLHLLFEAAPPAGPASVYVPGKSA